MLVVDVVSVLLAVLGHAILWISVLNHTHSIAMSPRLCKILSAVAILCAAAIFAGMVRPVIHAWGDPLLPGLLARWWPLGVYFALGATIGVVGGLSGLWHKTRARKPPAVLRSHRATLLHLDANNEEEEPVIDADEHHFLARFPGNQALKLDVTERGVEIPRLPQALEGLKVVHLSDLHFTGKVGRAYFEEVVRLANSFQPDLIAVTGDLVDTDECIAWVPETLGRLAARCGVFFILGNHDLRVDTARLRQTLIDCGLIYLGGRWIERPLRGCPVIFGGNELPWIKPAADLACAPPHSADGGPLRIVLAHSPDQFRWARSNDVDLLLAGHTHGGQIRLPLIGAVLAPSRWGVRYASGMFHRGPTVMNVSRGVSGKFPVRMRCPPEMIVLTLHAARDAK